MKKFFASALCLVLALGFAPTLTAAGKAQQTGQISGTAVVEGKPLPQVSVRVRNMDTGQVVANSTTNAQGQFNFTGLPAGNYVVETVSANGTVLGTSATVALTAGAMIAGAVTINTTAAAAAAAGIGATAGAAAAGLSTTAIVVTAAAVTAGATGVVLATGDDSSPSS
jgi:hypothetical protein